MQKRMLSARTAKQSCCPSSITPRQGGEFHNTNLPELTALAAIAKAIEDFSCGQKTQPIVLEAAVMANAERRLDLLVEAHGMKAISALRIANRGGK
ncbi:MAG: hypothetical protein ABII71_05135 [Candidatus Micrarchaeota archaeon]